MPTLYVDPRTGERYDYDGADAGASAAEQETHGLVPAEQYDRDKAYYDKSLLDKAGEAGTTFAQGTMALGTEASNLLGVVPPEDLESSRATMSTPEAIERRERHPIAAGAASAIPAALTGAGIGMLGGGLAVAAAAQMAESAISGLSQESLDAVTSKRAFSAQSALWNGVLDLGFGALGYVGGRALRGGTAEAVKDTAEAVGAGKRNWLSEVDPGDVAEGGRPMSAGAAANDFDDTLWDKAIKSVDDANGGKGAVPEARFLAQEAEPLTDMASAQIADNLDSARKIVKEDISEAVRVGDIDRIAGGEAAEQPFTLEGKTLDDLGALPMEGSDRAATLKGLRESPEFRATGRAPEAFDRRGHEVGVRLRQGESGEGRDLYLVDGRHRFTVAKEMDLPSVWGTIYDADNKQVFRGNIPLKAQPARTGGWSPEMHAAQDEWVAAHAVEGGRGVVDAIRNAKQASKIGEGFDAGGFGAKAIKQIDQGVNDVMASQGAQRFNQLNNLKRNVDATIRDLGRERSLNTGDAQQLIDVLRPYSDGIREGLERPDLWGKAAPLQRDVNAGWHAVIEPLSRMENRLSERLGQTWGATGQAAVNRRTKTAAVGQMLRAKAVDVRESLADISEALDGLGALAEARQAHGLGKLERLDALQKHLEEIKHDFNMAAVINVAKRKAGESGGGFGAQMINAGIGAVSSKVPVVGGMAGQGARGLMDRILNQAERPAANTPLGKVLERRLQAWSRNPDLADAGFSRSLPQWLQGSLRGKGGQVAGVAALAGGGAALSAGNAGAAELPSDTPEQVATRQQLSQQLAALSPEDQAVQIRTMDGLARINASTQQRVDRAVGNLFLASTPRARAERRPEVVALDKRAAKLDTSRSMARFMGRSDDAFAAFGDKQRMLNSVMLKPERLAATMAEHLGDLPRLQPELFAQMVAKTGQTAAYLHAMMPGNAGRSMLNPDGYAPTHDEIEEWAGHWAGALHPLDALDDLAVNDLQPEQMDAVKAMHPEAFATFQSTALQHIGLLAAKGQSIPQQALEQIDSALDLNGAGDQTLTWEMAALIQQAKSQSAPQEASTPVRPPAPKQSKYGAGIGSQSLATLKDTQ